MDHHPDVELIWNYWPLSMVFITPIRVLLNAFPLFFVLNIFSAPVSATWNIGPEILLLITAWGLSFPLYIPHIISATLDNTGSEAERTVGILLALMLHIAW